MQKVHSGVLILFMLLSFALKTSAQQHGIEAEKLGTPMEVYEIVKGFSARVVRSDDGSIREIYIQKIAYDGETVQCSPKITAQDRERILGKIMSPEDRGEKSEWFGFASCVGGCTASYDYEHLKVSQTTCTGLAPNCQDVLIIRFPRPPLSQ
jgi:hypothetical protein